MGAVTPVEKKFVQFECFSICALKFVISISFIDKVTLFSDTKILFYIFYIKKNSVVGTRKPNFFM